MLQQLPHNSGSARKEKEEAPRGGPSHHHPLPLALPLPLRGEARSRRRTVSRSTYLNSSRRKTEARSVEDLGQLEHSSIRNRGFDDSRPPQNKGNNIQARRIRGQQAVQGRDSSCRSKLQKLERRRGPNIERQP